MGRHIGAYTGDVESGGSIKSALRSLKKMRRSAGKVSNVVGQPHSHEGGHDDAHLRVQNGVGDLGLVVHVEESAVDWAHDDAGGELRSQTMGSLILMRKVR